MAYVVVSGVGIREEARRLILVFCFVVRLPRYES